MLKIINNSKIKKIMYTKSYFLIGIFLIAIIMLVFFCKKCAQDYKRIRQLTSDVLPVASGVRVYALNGGIPVIDIRPNGTP